MQEFEFCWSEYDFGIPEKDPPLEYVNPKISDS
jgi:hypothetical protein